MHYEIAPAGWSCSDPNPFTEDGGYGEGWSAFCVLAREDDQYLTGKSGEGPFSARFGRRVPHLRQRLADFLRYESAHGRTVIVAFPEDVDPRARVAQALAATPPPHVVRPEDPKIIVHATTVGAWQSIRRDGYLKVGARSKAKTAHTEVDAYLLDEPPDYSDHIMFGAVDSSAPEMVVASYQAGRFVMDEQAVYESGVRLYFDNHRIIEEGLGVRDGLHLMKVHRRLPLHPYLLGAVSVLDLAPLPEGEAWTVRAFVERANAAFHEGNLPV